MPDPSKDVTVARAFALDGAITDVRPLGNGLINETFLVTTDGRHRPRVVLQRINRRAFPQPERIMQNLRALTGHLDRETSPSRSSDAPLRLPRMIPTRDGRDFMIDTHGDLWRAIDYIENTVTLETIQSIQQAGEVGAALGRFHVLVADLNPADLRVTRPGFHQTSLYYERFTEAAARVSSVGDVMLDDCVVFARDHAAGVSVLDDAKRDGTLQARVIHGDPKLDNFLFDAATGRVVSLIDLDTVQPGLLHYDLGDCLRSTCNPAGESPPRVDDARFDLDICRTLLERYFAEARALLTAQDVAHLYHAIRLLPFELGLRFLTDHLDGDTYFKTEWRGHNLHRAQVQFHLTTDIEKNQGHIRRLIDALAGTR